MKRFICVYLIVILCVATVLPTAVSAETYKLGGTDISISVDNSKWYVFTRDNIKDNPELKKLGISYDTIYGILYDNDAYMDAIIFYEDGGYIEMFVRKKPVDAGLVNLSNYKDSEVLDFAKELAKKAGAENYTVYENQYKFARLDYKDNKLGYYMCEFITCVNKDNYTVTFQATSQYTQEEYAEIEKIVDSIQFDVDTSIKEPIRFRFNLVRMVLAGAAVGGIAGGIVAIKTKKKKKQNEKMEATTPDIKEIQ
jgi:hypothetical protein